MSKGPKKAVFTIEARQTLCREIDHPVAVSKVRLVDALDANDGSEIDPFKVFLAASLPDRRTQHVLDFPATSTIRLAESTKRFDLEIGNCTDKRITVTLEVSP